MFSRILRLTPGYIRYLQTQAAQSRQDSERSLVSCYAVLLGLMGTGMSGYSSHQLALNYSPSPHLRWDGRGKGK